MTFRAHLEYIHHITCDKCKHYWTYATMDPKFDISRGEWFCPLCGTKGAVHLEDHRVSIQDENYFSGSAHTETSTDWFPNLKLVKKSVAEKQPTLPNLCLCEDSPKDAVCTCSEFD